MYQITCDEYILHDPRIQELKVIGAKCDLEVNKTGALSFQIAPNHPYYDKIKKHTSRIALYQDSELIFAGRVLNDDIAFDNIKTIECEGDLSYLLDSIQQTKLYNLKDKTNAIKDYLSALISNHNSQMKEDRKKFTLGNVTITDTDLKVGSNYETTLDLINSKLVEMYGGYIIIRYENDKKYLDYIAESTKTCSQVIEFGKNIVDMTRKIKGEEIITALFPLGASLSSSEWIDKRVTIKSCSDETSGDIVKSGEYIYSKQGVEKYGWIFGAYTWDDVTSATKLLSTAKTYFKELSGEVFSLELTAIDLNLLDVSIEKIKIGEKVRCLSTPNNIDQYMFVQSMSIDIDSPASTVVNLTMLEGQQFFTSPNDSITQKQADDNKTISDVHNYTVEDLVDNKTLDDTRQWVEDNFMKSTSGGIDLSEYAKVADVNTAFTQLATKLEEV